MRRRLILVDAYGGDVLEGEKAQSVPERMVTAVLQVAPRNPEYHFMLVGNPYEINQYLRTKPSNVSAEPGRGKSYRAITRIGEIAEERQVAGIYTLADNREVVTVVAKSIGVFEEAKKLFPKQKNVTSPIIAEVPKSATVKRADTWYILDAGAAPELTTPEQYVSYAKLGAHYAEAIGQRRDPAIGLLNIGAEVGKGGPLLKEAYNKLKESGLNFIGNVEPYACVNDRDKGTKTPRPIDVVVASGEDGNNLIKSLAAGAQYVADAIRTEIEENSGPLEKLAAWMLRKLLRRVKRQIDPSRMGGAYFACSKIPVNKNHGTSTIEGNIAGLEKTIWFIENNTPALMRPGLKQAA